MMEVFLKLEELGEGGMLRGLWSITCFLKLEGVPEGGKLRGLLSITYPHSKKNLKLED